MNVLNTALEGNLHKLEYKHKKPEHVTPHERKKVIAASAIGSAIGIAGAVAGVYSLAKKGNPSVSIKNLTYNEKDILMIGAGSILGGLTGGLLSDKHKENKIPKLREASLQFFGSLACPLGILAVANNLLEKSGFEMPKLSGTSKLVKHSNVVLSTLPKILVTIGSLVAGMNIGNRIMNKVNNKIFDQKENREVHASDYLVHADDICVAASLLLKDNKSIAAITSKALPASFILAGTKAGSEHAEH